MKFLKKNQIFYIIVACFSVQMQGSLPINFDDPFPASPTKKVITSCMKIRSAVNAAQERSSIHQTDFPLLGDIVLGRLAYLDYCVDQMIGEKNQLYKPDLAYIVNVFEHVGYELKQTFQIDTIESLGCMQRIISTIQNKLEKVAIE